MPRLNTNPETRNGSPAGGSTLMTSAPSSASSAPAYGPATNVPMSSTRKPASGPSPTGGSPSGAALGARGVVIPRQAALVTGERELVFVEDSAGRFVPRLVTLGVESDSLVEVRAGLRAGERVVATAAFLLDAEANLSAAMAGMAGMPGMEMGGPGGAKAPAPPAAAPTGHRH